MLSQLHPLLFFLRGGAAPRRVAARGGRWVRRRRARSGARGPGLGIWPVDGMANCADGRRRHRQARRNSMRRRRCQLRRRPVDGVVTCGGTPCVDGTAICVDGRRRRCQLRGNPMRRRPSTASSSASGLHASTAWPTASEVVDGVVNCAGIYHLCRKSMRRRRCQLRRRPVDGAVNCVDGRRRHCHLRRNSMRRRHCQLRWKPQPCG